MRKTLLTATALAMSASLAGFAYAADLGGSTPATESSVVSTVPASTGTTSARFDDHGQRDGGHGADDPVGHDAGDDHGGRTAGVPSSDDGANHDVGDDHGGRGGHGADDGPNHDAGDDHGGHGGHGSDD